MYSTYNTKKNILTLTGIFTKNNKQKNNIISLTKPGLYKNKLRENRYASVI